MKKKIIHAFCIALLLGASFTVQPPKAHAEEVFSFFQDVFDAVVEAVVPDFIYEFFYCDVLNAFLPSCDTGTGNQTSNTANTAPLPPSITHTPPQRITASNYSYLFNLLSSDPDNDEIQYAIDWSDPADEIIDLSLPGESAYIPSGTAQQVTKNFSPTTSHSFSVKAIDSKGLSSGWTSYSISPVDPNTDTTNPLSASCTISSPTDQRLIAPGTEVIWTAVTNGGNGNYSYLWDNSNTPTSNTYRYTMPATGTFTPTSNTVKDTSSPQNTANFSCPTAGVVPVTCEADTERPQTGTLVTWSIKEGGVLATNPNYTYTWTNGVTRNTFYARLESLGSFTPTITVTDRSNTPTQTYTPTCTTVTWINPSAAPTTMSFKAIPNSGSVTSPVYESSQAASTIIVNVNQKFKLDWSIANIIGCTPSSDSTTATSWLNQNLTNNPVSSLSDLRITKNTRYTVACTSSQDGLRKTASVQVNVTPVGVYEEF